MDWGAKMTIKDVAKYCGVSVSTVSRALNGHPDVSEDMRAKVIDAARLLHYVPNRSARDLASNQSDTLGLVVRGSTNPFFDPVMHAIESECNELGYGIVHRYIASDGDEIAAAAEFVQAKRLKGVILLGGRFDYSEEDAKSIGAPFVCCSYSNHFGDLPKEEYSSVSINDIAEAYKATKALIDLGHRRIAILLFSTDDKSISQLRFDGYCQALKDAGIEFDRNLVFETGTLSMSSAYEKVRGAIDSGIQFSAIFSIADTMAVAAMKAIFDTGAKVPDDYSVIGIDGIEMSLYTIPTLATLCQPQESMGREAARILVDVVEGKTKNQHVRLKTTQRPGGSMGPAKKVILAS
ncbi:MAG: LacI family transcriptional regulator [Coriobacteriaceae bacterium]|nr:MAG: LacI family transcriptional regulator [Coriobacteriaceae bacterium]